jgi:hypothetical protein
MTRDRDIERVLDRWFADGPSHMPDRFFDAVLDRVDRVPQRRLARLLMRFTSMNASLRYATAAVVVAAIVGVGALLVSRFPLVGTSPSPTPTSSQASPGPSSAASASPVPASLRYDWWGPTRTVTGVPSDRASINFNSSFLRFDGGADAPSMSSRVTVTGSDRLRLQLLNAFADCAAGAAGTYSFQLSPGATKLTLTNVEDQCVPRSEVIAGEWLRANCPDPTGSCVGDLEAGDYTSAIFNPWVDATKWQYSFGRLGYTVPAGWSNTQDCFGCYLLAKQGAPKDTGILVFDDIVAHSQGAQMCQALNEAGIGRDARSLADWLASRPGLVATKPAPVSVGGLSGYTLDLSVKPTWSQTCPYSNGQPMVSTFSDADPAEHDGFDWGIGGDAHVRYLLLDIGDGRALVIDIEAQTKADFDALLPDAMGVISTFHFNR